MGSYELLCTVLYKYISFHAKCVGHNILDPAFKPTALTHVCLAMWYSFFVFTIFTAFTDAQEVIYINIFFACMCLQGIFKSHLILTKTQQLRKLINFISEIHIANKDNFVNAYGLRRIARWNLLISKFLVAMWLVTASAAIVNPLLMYLVTGNLEPVLPIKIPFVHLETKSGYAVHSICLVVLIITGYFGMVASELLLITLTIQIAPMAKIFDKAINDLNETIGGNRHEAIKNSTWLRINVRNLALMHKEIYLYVAYLSELYYPVFTIELYSDQFALIVLLYVIGVLKWLPGILFFVAVILKLLCFCLLGTAVQFWNDNIYNSLVNLDFVLLPPRDQKMYLLMTHAAQHPASFSAGRVKLNLIQFVEVVKSIYTCGMVLIESA